MTGKEVVLLAESGIIFHGVDNEPNVDGTISKPRAPDDMVGTRVFFSGVPRDLKPGLGRSPRVESFPDLVVISAGGTLILILLLRSVPSRGVFRSVREGCRCKGATTAVVSESGIVTATCSVKKGESAVHIGLDEKDK